MKKYWLPVLIAVMLLSLPVSAEARSGGPVTVQFPDTVLHSEPTTDPNQFPPHDIRPHLGSDCLRPGP
jgi:hypothetical protein